jgi:hypothetical protein
VQLRIDSFFSATPKPHSLYCKLFPPTVSPQSVSASFNESGSSSPTHSPYPSNFVEIHPSPQVTVEDRSHVEVELSIIREEWPARVWDTGEQKSNDLKAFPLKLRLSSKGFGTDGSDDETDWFDY